MIVTCAFRRNIAFRIFKHPTASLVRRTTAAPVWRHVKHNGNHRHYASPADGTTAEGPNGDLFLMPTKSQIGPNLVGQTARVRRTFGPQANEKALLATGGEALAAHSSFDPDYRRAQGWIRHHAVGTAVLSPILIAGLSGALVEAAFPQSVPVSQSMTHMRPLIVGVAVEANIEVLEVVDARAQQPTDTMEGSTSTQDRRHGYQVTLKTETTRVRDNGIISQGMHVIWIPDYLKM